MVGEEAPFIAAHAEVIDKDRTCCGRLRGGVEGSFEGSEDVGDVLVEIACLTRRFPDKLRLIMRQMS